jgi:hypothetical protein
MRLDKPLEALVNTRLSIVFFAESIHLLPELIAHRFELLDFISYFTEIIDDI